jgi:peptidoglycan/xylan/chitin deacetylase (PgdA/CDA1 family)
VDINKYELLYVSPSITVTPDKFDKQIRYLANRYNIISLDELVDAMNNGYVPKNSLVITFDDGYRDNFIHAYPVLKKYRAYATIYLTTNCIGTNNMIWMHKVFHILQTSSAKNIEIADDVYTLEDMNNILHVAGIIGKLVKRMRSIDERDRFLHDIADRLGVMIKEDEIDNMMLSWDEIRAMKQAGLLSFGAHTLTHPNLPSLATEEAEKEIEGSKKVIEDKIGGLIRLFSFPDGGAEIHYNRAIQDIVQDCGYACAVTSDSGVVDKDSDIYALPRIGVNKNNRLMDIAVGIVTEKLFWWVNKKIL